MPINSVELEVCNRKVGSMSSTHNSLFIITQNWLIFSFHLLQLHMMCRQGNFVKNVFLGEPLEIESQIFFVFMHGCSVKFLRYKLVL